MPERGQGVRVAALAISAVLSACVHPPPTSTPAEPSDTAKAWQAFDEAGGDAPFVDFSAAGVNYSEAAHGARVETLFSVADYGAYPDDQIDDTRAIQKTIDAAEAAGGGIVSFRSGTYRINEHPAFGSLWISTSNIVLRGSDEGETRLWMTHAMPLAEPGKKWTGPAMIVFKPKDVAAPSSSKWSEDDTHIVLESAPAGSRQIRVRGAGRFEPGSYITFAMRSLEAREAFLNGKPTRPIWDEINTKGVPVSEHHEVARVEGDVIHLRQPLLTEVDAGLPWRVQKLDLIEHVGFENICFDGSFNVPFEHHKNGLHDSGFRAIGMTRTAHSWVTGSCFRNVSSAVTFGGGLANMALLNRIEGNAGHFSLNAEFSTRTLFGLNMDLTATGQFHGPGASHMSVGTVVWRYIGLQTGGFDTHALFPRHTLLDQVQMAGLSKSGGHYRNLPNHGAGMVFWNYHQTQDIKSGHSDKDVLDFWDLPEDEAQKYWFTTIVDPVMVGYRGPITEINEDNMGWVENFGVPALPNSLFEAQIARRLGARPDWMETALADWQALKARHLSQTDAAGAP